MGIHYTRKAFEGQIKMEKQAKKEKRRLEKLAKKNAKAQEKGLVEKAEQDDKTIPLNETITLAHLTDPENNKK